MNDSQQPNTPDLEDSKLSALYQQSRIEEPSMKLDSTILTQARTSTEKQPAEKRSYFGFNIRWLIPLSSFALAMLTVTLFIQIKQEHPAIIAPSTIQIEENMSDDLKNDLNKTNIGETHENDAAGALTPVMKMKSAPAEMEIAPARSLKKQPMQQELTGESHFRMRDETSPASTLTAPSETKALKRQAIADPENWIIKIRALLAQHKKAEAIKELEAFKAAYPDYPLPADLQALNK